MESESSLFETLRLFAIGCRSGWSNRGAKISR